MNSVLIITGGTGGHIFPALAVGEKLRMLGVNPLFIVRRNRNDLDFVSKHGFEYKAIPASGFFGKNIFGMFLFFLNMIFSTILFPSIIFKARPLVVIASGGFISVVPILWSIILHKRIFLLEQNRIPGRFTKYFSRWADEIYSGFPPIKKISGRLFYTGNPLRSEIISESDYSNRKSVLVLGGSQGAQFLNLVAVELAARMPNVQFTIQTGKRDYVLINKKVKSSNVELIDFTLSPENLYKKAKIVITRAGGMVLSEILSFGIPSIIIPFPFATDNHQAANAQFLAQNGAAIILDQCRQQEISETFIHKLKEMVLSILNDDKKYQVMSDNAKKIAKSDAAEVIAMKVKKCLEN
jgi:UDP-N-acetylglucosamine--N-acetylmuramyl-(pentapeptide) pyrophosphoryl-undecaprenol N-acetylglucosamine transferase